jgi:hypothetical protein
MNYLELLKRVKIEVVADQNEAVSRAKRTNYIKIMQAFRILKRPASETTIATMVGQYTETVGARLEEMADKGILRIAYTKPGLDRIDRPFYELARDV